jgi:hypothetical protein
MNADLHDTNLRTIVEQVCFPTWTAMIAQDPEILEDMSFNDFCDEVILQLD